MQMHIKNIYNLKKNEYSDKYFIIFFFNNNKK